MTAPASCPPRVLVVGLGRSGLAAARLAAHDGAEVVVTDTRGPDELAEVLDGLPDTARSILGGHPDACLDDIDLVVTSPGVAADAPILERARSRGIAVTTELEYAWTHRPEAPMVAVTGSNGKSTVTVLVDEMLRASGVRSVAGGNLGRPASELVLDPSWQVWVLEVSSFQSELFTEVRPRVGVLLNLSQDHLERHPSLASYLAAKRRVFARQEPADSAVLNADDSSSASTTARSRRLFFSLEKEADAWLDGERLVVLGEELVRVPEVGVSGRHNIANSLAAALAAAQLGGRHDAMASALRGFEGLEHRHQTVVTAAGVRWVDDSKATNVGATVAALGGYTAGTVHLILGGLGKGQDFSPLRNEVGRAAARVYLIGADAELIAHALPGDVPKERCGDLPTAVSRAGARARPGQVVLLAPACASFDQFTDYTERGRVFASLVRKEASTCR